MRIKIQRFCSLIFAIFLLHVSISISQNLNTWTWKKKADYKKPRSSCSAFVIGSNAYVGVGTDSIGFKRSFYVYSPALSIWQQIASLGGAAGGGLARNMASATTIGNFGYVGLGQGSLAYMNDWWQYDPATDTWTQKANLPGVSRRGAVSFTIGAMGYVGLGETQNGFVNDFWQYNPSSNTWISKAIFGGTGRRLAAAFVIGTKAYVGTGDAVAAKNDFWEYDSSTNTWTQKADFAGSSRTGAVAFEINGFGYLGTGYDTSSSYKRDLWQYDVLADTWTPITNFAGTARANAVAFKIDGKVYLGTGYDGFLKGDFWEFSPSGLGIQDYNFNNSASVYPNPVLTQATFTLTDEVQNAFLKIYDLQGKEIKQIVFSGQQVVFERENIESGIYFYQIISKQKTISSGKLIIQ